MGHIDGRRTTRPRGGVPWIPLRSLPPLETISNFTHTAEDLDGPYRHMKYPWNFKLFAILGIWYLASSCPLAW